MHVAFATSRAHSRLTSDDLLAAAACHARGIRVTPAVWDDPAVRWASFDAVIVRSTWDYHRRVDDFLAWLAILENVGVPVWNPIALLRWNANKRYLGDLDRRGVSTVPTAWITVIDASSLASVMDERGWSDVVVKPVISATAYGTHRVRRTDAEGAGRAMGDGATGEYLVQPFLPEIQTLGEWSLIFFRGAFSHSVRKRPVAGDFRVQTEYGGSSITERAPTSVIEAGAAALDAVDGPWLYARVDGVETPRGFVLMELEMLEPMLFFDRDAEAPVRFAAALESLLTMRSPGPRSPIAAPPR